MKQLIRTEIRAHTVKQLGLDPTRFNLESTESIAEALRRAAGIACPCPPRTLITFVTIPLHGLVDNIEQIAEQVEQVLEAMISYGDLIECREISHDKTAKSRILVYAAAPAFVYIPGGSVFLLGVMPDHALAVPKELESSVDYRDHTRRLPIDGATSADIDKQRDDILSHLRQFGMVELSARVWLKTPSDEMPKQHLSKFDRMLDNAPMSGDIPGLKIIDPATPVKYYRSRWIEPVNITGRFVGRRPQAYGANLWCYVEVQKGQPKKFIDLPITQEASRGCDDAFRLQAAIDAHGGGPQIYRIRDGIEGSKILDLFSPVPSWAERRWTYIGQRVQNTGCLLSFQFNSNEIEEELEFARNKLWLERIP